MAVFLFYNWQILIVVWQKFIHFFNNVLWRPVLISGACQFYSTVYSTVECIALIAKFPNVKKVLLFYSLQYFQFFKIMFEGDIYIVAKCAILSNHSFSVHLTSSFTEPASTTFMHAFLSLFIFLFYSFIHSSLLQKCCNGMVHHLEHLLFYSYHSFILFSLTDVL